MAKKSLYVVIQTVVGRVSLSVETFILGYSEELNEAKKLLKNKYDRLSELGYDTSRFEHTKRGWMYKSDYVINKFEIQIATSI